MNNQELIKKLSGAKLWFNDVQLSKLLDEAIKIIERNVPDENLQNTIRNGSGY